MDPHLWQRLSVELEERVLSFLPVPDVCRCRAVCKSWDYLTSTPEFCSLSRYNAARSHTRYIVGRVVRRVESEPEFHGWVILDLDGERWYRINHDYSPFGSRVEGIEAKKPEEADEDTLDENYYDVGFVAAHQGLVCEFLPHSLEAEGPRINVYNPVTREPVAEMLDVPDHCVADASRGIVNIVADGVEDKFKLFFINLEYNHGEDCEARYCKGTIDETKMRHCVMPVYDSTTGKWRSSRNPPWLGTDDDSLNSFIVNDHRCSVVFQGFLYVLFSYMHRNASNDPVMSYWLCKYHSDKDLWEDTDVRFDEMMLRYHTKPQLIASGDRLFLLSQQPVTRLEPIVLREIFLADHSHSVVFEMSRALVQGMTGIATGDYIDAFGYGKSLIFTSNSAVAEYSLVDNSWYRFPPNPQQPLLRGWDIWYAPTVNLRLPRRGSRPEKKSSDATRGKGDAGPS